jgi:nucleoside-diphosphate-sugar epimerase
MAVLITGGVGMIGSNIVRRLALQAGEDVVVFDRVPAPVAHSPLADLNGVDYVVGSITDLSLLLHTIKKYRVNSIVHLAAMIAGEASDRPVEAMEVNVMGTLNVLEAARLMDIGGRVVVFSASAVMGGPEDTVTPRSEDEVVLPAAGIYTITKLTAEQLVNCYRDLYGVDTVAVRPRAVYGPGISQTSYVQPIPALIWAACRGDDVVHPVGADTKTNLTYAKDEAAGIVRLLRHPAPLPTYVYNLSSGEVVSHGDVARILSKIFPNQRIELGPGLAEGVLKSGSQTDLTWRMIERPPHSVDRAKKDFGFNPTWSAERGVTDYVRWLQTGEYGEFD